MSGERQLDNRLKAIGGTNKAILTRLGLRAVFHSKALVPRKTGNLGRTIRVAGMTATSVRVEAGGTNKVGYAAFVEFGTKPHDIVPRNKKVLRFATGGNARLSGSPRSGAPAVFTKRVRHPGTKAHPYLVPGSQKALRDEGLKDQIVTAWNRAA